ncbi:glycosyl transferase, group 1 family protein [Ligilactobacillus ruminis DPC 6832]|uniref:Glycosyl transferase, group 1 family protein n=1 Tax=Ligilactobacillus ruminis DPC 6832 TaxID=1402208 RepID=A0A837DW91_9LACO|nr:glycosyl transferase, group 1 family protein [Ligilactobacillus ruminis DPC 6832]
MESKYLGAYGGYETFIYKLTDHNQNNENIKYLHVKLAIMFAWMKTSLTVLRKLMIMNLNFIMLIVLSGI